MARLLARQPATLEEPPTADKPYLAWTKDEVRPIQKELRRMRLYNLGIDGVLGKISDQGLVEAFGGDEWRTMDSAGVLERLKAAERPKPKGAKGGDFRYGELFKDGLLDLTFGYGFMEELSADEWVAYAKEMEDALVARGYVEDAKKAAELYAAAGRKTSAFGRFFVKPDALQYDPPAGDPRPIHSIVRFIMNPGGDKGAEAKEAFEAGMAQGDVTYYSGHGRYGTGPDFDPNFGKIELLDAEGNVELEPENYKVLRQVLSDESGGNPWTRFKWREKRGRIRIDLKNAGNLRMNAKSPHMDEFGGKLIQWALDQNGGVDVATGKEGSMAGADGRQPRPQVPRDGLRRLQHPRLRARDPQDAGLRHARGRHHRHHAQRRVRRRGRGVHRVPRRARRRAVARGDHQGDERGDEAARERLLGRAVQGRGLRGQPVAMSAADRLKNAEARPETAAALAREGDPAVLGDLVAAFDDRVETGGDAVLDAIRDLGGAAEGRRLATSADAGERRVAARLMSLQPQPENLAALEPLLEDPDPEVAGAARKALRHQWRTPAWHQAVERLSRSEDPALRETAEALLRG